MEALCPEARAAGRQGRRPRAAAADDDLAGRWCGGTDESFVVFDRGWRMTTGRSWIDGTVLLRGQALDCGYLVPGDLDWLEVLRRGRELNLDLPSAHLEGAVIRANGAFRLTTRCLRNDSEEGGRVPVMVLHPRLGFGTGWIEVRASPATVELVPLASCGAVSGRVPVVDPAYSVCLSPVAMGAGVDLAAPIQSECDRRGFFEFEGLPEGRYFAGAFRLMGQGAELHLDLQRPDLPLAVDVRAGGCVWLDFCRAAPGRSASSPGPGPITRPRHPSTPVPGDPCGLPGFPGGGGTNEVPGEDPGQNSV